MKADPTTAAELHALVSQWPAEARPKDLDMAYNEWYNTNSVSMIYDDSHALDLHIASGLRWLLSRGRVKLFPPGPNGVAYAVACGLKLSTGLTPFLALHAAIISQKEGGDAQ